MQTVIVETRIAAPPERCFLLSLSIDLHVQSASQTGERAVEGVTQGLIGLGETVTWEGRHFGIKLRHKTLITKYERPHHFQDVMVTGAFRRFEHDHYFAPMQDGGTLMRDVLLFAAPLGPVGWVAEVLLLRSYLKQFLIRRNALICRTAQHEEAWKRFLPTQ